MVTIELLMICGIGDFIVIKEIQCELQEHIITDNEEGKSADK